MTILPIDEVVGMVPLSLYCTLAYDQNGRQLGKKVIEAELEHVIPITPHANGKPLLKWSSLTFTFFPTILLVVCKQQGSALTSKASFINLLNDNTYR